MIQRTKKDEFNVGEMSCPSFFFTSQQIYIYLWYVTQSLYCVWLVLIFLYIEEKSKTDLIVFSPKLPSSFFLNKNIFIFDTLHKVCVRLVFFCLFIEEKSDTDRLVSFPKNTNSFTSLHFFYILHKVCVRLVFIFLYI